MIRHKTDIYIGIFLALLSLFLIFIINPISITVPDASVVEEGSVTPIFFPNLISFLILIFSSLLIFNSYYSTKNNINPEESLILQTKLEISVILVRILSLFTILIFPYICNLLGIILSSIILYILFAIYCGERRWMTPILGSIISTIILYYFFVKIASVPLPLGVLENIL
jgi:hypothetical protein